MNNRFFDFREKYPQFIYSGYNISDTKEALFLDFHFIIPGLAEFKPQWEIRKTNQNPININDEKLKKLVFSLGMVELISYWKTTCSPEITINCGNLSQAQLEWWKKLYIKGLGEFFYQNNINFIENMIKIKSSNNQNESKSCNYNHDSKNDVIVHNDLKNDKPKVLIPIGGGKDSAVTLELLDGYAIRFCYIINPRKATLDTVKVSQVPDSNVFITNRSLDENMLALNKQGFLNGHTPFSALVAFSSVLVAYINGIDYVALSNESSANEPTVFGTDVNHQYSKSLEFETDFINYESKYIKSGVKYFSFLRPLNEISVARIFSKLKKYHPVFKSCNVGSKEDIWCAGCSKCLFVYIILSPFLSEKELVNIFSKNMLDDPKMLSDFEKLIGLKPEKPFECVGSCDEVNAAVQETIKQYKEKDKPLPYLLKAYEDFDKKGIKVKQNINDLCNNFDDNNFVPEHFVKALKTAVHNERNDHKE
ncbi:MAG: hypothetical protein LBC73_07015 [Oscillospiraceae bacterium]|jgi:hypothetical protein|nr:hypothetical protein [Oscillospiraceae bacterium]